MKNNLKVKGRVCISVKSPDGIQVIKKDNLVVNTGLTNILNLLNGGGFAITDIGFGTDDTAATATDTDLTTKFDKAITSGSVIFPDIEILGELLTSENNGMTIQEIGLFDSNGDLFSRAVVPAIVKTNLITVSVTWAITLSA
jgi:hypothetical protein